jgi:Ca-activated chloride channel family protein
MQLPFGKPAKIARSCPSPVARRTRLARRFFHGALLSCVATAAALAVGSTVCPVEVASGQTRPAENAAPAVSLEAHADDGAPSLLPLVSESLNVQINDGHAAATYRHVFQNESAARVEGNYRLLVGEGATATGFAYYNGQEKIVGEIFERDAARQVYDALTGLRRDPGLLEQAGEGGFSFHVFPIEAGERKRVEVTTSQWLPRRGDEIEYRVRLGRPDANVVLTVNDARGVKGLESSSHDLRAERKTDGSWTATVLKAKTSTTDELVVRYQTDEAPLVLHGAIHHDAGQPAFFSVTLAAPLPPIGKVRAGNDVTLVLDRSGSMGGPSLESARAAAKAIVQRLLPTDRVNVITFDDGVDSLYDTPQPLTDAVRRKTLDHIGSIESGGGTDIAKALAKALSSQIHDDHPDIVLFLTDGQSSGPPAIQVATDDRGDARVFTVGIGTGVDKALLSRIASIKHGRFTFIADPRAVAVEFPKVLSQLEDPVLTDVTLHAEGGATIERMYPETPGDLFAADELRVFGRASAEGRFKVVLEAKEHGMPRRYEAQLDASVPSNEPWVARSWARARVEDLLEEISAKGESEELKGEAVDLGLAFSLVTPYTSFLAIPESAMTEAAKNAVGSMRERRKRILAMRSDAAALSRLNMPPGDPILRVQAPRDAKRVAAIFPFGLTQDLAYDTMSESWMTRFLVPKDVADGTYEVRTVIELADGTVNVAVVRYTIDSRAPQVDVDTKASGDGVDVRVLCDEPALEVRMAPVDDFRRAFSLTGEANKLAFKGHIALAPGHHRIRIVVADAARNESEREVDVDVPSHGSEAL